MQQDDSRPALNTFLIGDAVSVLGDSGSEFVDLTVTSPPYDTLRDYKGYSFDPGRMLQAIFNATVEGGVCVWVVGEKINKGRSLTSFEHAFIGREIGWTVHDIMIYQKKNTPFMRKNAYTNCYELMIVFAKGKPKTFNPLTEPTKRNGWETAVHNKGADGVNRKRPVELKTEKVRNNIWQYAVGLGGTTKDKIAFQHPAVFPEQLASDHIRSWSNAGDTVLDPMCGSGTTCKMAAAAGRNWLGIDISAEYVAIAQQRLEQSQ
ncbi:MAG: site-specific DNA-methyltransferase [Alphaproteobacteria bacterium]|nr:site-specific DNA-methyltransferase [Alphaproteobacteria bacterium]